MDDFMRAHSKEVNAIFKAKLLAHPDSGKLAAYIVSNGANYADVGATADALMHEAMTEVYNALNASA